MDEVLGDKKLRGNVMLNYLSLCHDDATNLGNGLLCGDRDWPSPMGVIFQTLPAMFEFSSPLLRHAV